MKILHYYQQGFLLISLHVKMLCEGMGVKAENHIAITSDDARTLLLGGKYDILHLHGCWRNSSYSIVKTALRQGTRLVVTPHGQLEPWVVNEHWWKEKFTKQMIYQRDIINKAYAVILHGHMEQENMNQLGWNRRCVIIRNCVITRSISTQNMARQTMAVYRKIMDSNPLELMTDETKAMLKRILNAGITGNVRWLAIEKDNHFTLNFAEWRKLLCYAHQEEISDTMSRGIRILGLEAPDFDVSEIAFFTPDDYTPTNSIQAAIGNSFVSESDRLIATFRHLRRLAASHQLCIRHFIELDFELRLHECDEDLLKEKLKEQRLYMLATRLMQLTSELTGLTEGFMPVPPLNDHVTQRIRHQIYNHFKI